MCRKKFTELQILRFGNLPSDAADVAPAMGLPQNAQAELQFAWIFLQDIIMSC